MDQALEKDLYLLFNMAYDGLDKIDLSNSPNDTDLADVENFLRSQEDMPQVAIINTRSKIYPKALIFRKIVKEKAVLFAFWKRGNICEGIAASLDGISDLNEFVWVQDSKSGKFKAKLKPKLDISQKKERQAMMTRVAVSTVVVESLNRREYREKFNGDILKKLHAERTNLFQDMKERGLIPNDATDPATRVVAPVNASKLLTEFPTANTKHSEFIAVQKAGGVTYATQSVEDGDMANKLARELAREQLLADREEEKAKKK